jgi:ABC-type antimicrobial peptide transport system permease subunit
MTHDSKIECATEAITNQVVAFILGTLTQLTILPLVFGIQVSLTQAIPISIMFMVVNGLKTYMIRRIFVKAHNQ